MSNHPQVPFVTAGGAFTTVDKGLFHVLSELRRLGVETQYSCQGSNLTLAAYVLADRESFGKVLRRIYRAYRLHQLTPEQRNLVRDFLLGYREYECRFYNHVPPKRGTRTIFHYVRHFGLKTMSRFSIEQTIDNAYGLRTTVRWPTERTEEVLDLLHSLK